MTHDNIVSLVLCVPVLRLSLPYRKMSPHTQSGPDCFETYIWFCPSFPTDFWLECGSGPKAMFNFYFSTMDTTKSSLTKAYFCTFVTPEEFIQLICRLLILVCDPLCVDALYDLDCSSLLVESCKLFILCLYGVHYMGPGLTCPINCGHHTPQRLQQWEYNYLAKISSEMTDCWPCLDSWTVCVCFYVWGLMGLSWTPHATLAKTSDLVAYLLKYATFHVCSSHLVWISWKRSTNQPVHIFMLSRITFETDRVSATGLTCLVCLVVVLRGVGDVVVVTIKVTLKWFMFQSRVDKLEQFCSHCLLLQWPNLKMWFLFIVTCVRYPAVCQCQCLKSATQWTSERERGR